MNKLSIIWQYLSTMSPNVIGSVIGGAIVVLLVDFFRKISSYLTRRKFKRIFGEDILQESKFHLAYAILGLMQEKGSVSTHPYIKPGEEAPGTFFSAEKAVSSCELRAAKYLAEVIGIEARQAPVLSADYDLMSQLNISFISFGGPKSNLKTRDAVENEGNELIGFDNFNFFSKKSGRVVLHPEQSFDYGLILKLHPIQFPRRVWFVCAGICEWGTSGAAYYLRHKWKEIYRYSKQKPFAIIVRVRNNQDESAFPVVRVKNSNEAEKYADMIEKQLSAQEGNSSISSAQDSTPSTPMEVTPTPSGSASNEPSGNSEPFSVSLPDPSGAEHQNHENSG